MGYRGYPAFEYGGFIAQRNEAPVLDEEDRIAARNLVAFFRQWKGDVFERWSVGPGWQLILSRNEDVRWLDEGLEPTEAEEIAKRRQPPEQNHRAVLDLAVRLGQRGQGDVALVHGRRSAVVYSGSVLL